MHSNDTTSGRRYHHNGDFSGEIRIEMRESEVDHHAFEGQRRFTVAISLEDLRDIVRTADRYKRMARLEELGDF